MGTNIRAFIDYFGAEWRTFCELHLPRDYAVQGELVYPVKPRGLPWQGDSLCQWNCDDTLSDDIDHSWLTTREFDAAIRSASQGRVLHRSYWVALQTMRDLSLYFDVRIVFSFST